MRVLVRCTSKPHTTRPGPSTRGSLWRPFYTPSFFWRWPPSTVAPSRRRRPRGCRPAGRPCCVSMGSASGDGIGPRDEDFVMPQIALSLLLDHALKLAVGVACDATKAETLEGLAVAYAEGGQPARAATILRRVWQMARGLPDPSERNRELRWLAEACIEATLEDLALAVAANLVRTADRASVAVDLAQHHLRAGRTQQATA